MSGFSGPPPRTVSSGAPVDPSKLADFRRPRPQAASTSPPPSRSPGQSPAPPRAPTPGGADTPENNNLPEGITHFYPASDFIDMKRNRDESKLPPSIRDIASKLWPEDTQRPDTVWSRDMFSDKERVVKDRKLSNMVLGILGRITPQNYEAMKKELFDLPIRQSTDEEITDVVHMMYTKAVRPEDELYTELYANLMSDLVKHTGVQNVGKTIRKAIIDKCQQQFEKPFRLADDELEDAEGNPLPQEEIDSKKAQLKAKLRANIKFLGHIFLAGMVNEKVVNYVLFHLLYGRQEETTKKRRPEEYELEMFVDLLRKVVKSLSPKTLNEYIPGYMNSLENLMPKVSNRIKFMLQDLQELYKNKWVEKRRAVPGRTTGPVKLDEFEKLDAEQRAREQQEFERAAARAKVSSPKTPAPRQSEPSTPAVPLPKKDEVYEAMETFRQDGVPTGLESFFKAIPAKERPGYLVHWLIRIVKQVKKSEDRKKFGDVVETLRQSNAMQPSEIERAVFDVATRIVVENLLEDNPKLWQCWAEMINSCKATVTHEAHTFLLRALIRGGQYPTPVETIIDFVETVIRAPDPHVQFRDPIRRFRPLPPILQYQNPMPDPTIPDDEVDEGDEDTGDDDLLAKVIERLQPNETNDELIDPEIAVFDTLSASIAVSELTDFIRKHVNRTDPLFVAKVAGAIFTYVRCDTTGTAIDRLKEPLKVIAESSQTNDVIIVQESFMMWNHLTKSPQVGFQRFVERLVHLGILTPAAFEKAYKGIDARATKEYCEATGFKPTGKTGSRK
eukprot:CAMPEP_0174854710 /NCGR_PEP_ID=MMETSP1114-20130205/31907_1 /TAXON_ID=312471 /ORGANISM="Neobodo designis, Strain CCAP 1951/1" /LENGTH=785 /DNA_ID=CAMNT_0016089421 /DNA_START=41 /DNA_END=2398 /DNA_ORIENTATION=-